MGPKSEWWETFFPGPWGEWQAKGFMQENTLRDADLLMTALKLKTGDQVLDVACGNGRHAIELATRGIEVTGIDFNGAMLALAEAKADEQSVEPLFLKADMRCLRFHQEFDAAYCFWTSFGYFEDESHDYVVLRRIAESLRPGGRFLLDLMTVETLLPVFRPELIYNLDESGTRQLRQNVRIDFETGRTEGDWTFIENGQTRTVHSSLRLYSYRELCALLREAGFERFDGFDTITGQPFAPGAKRLALVASL
jgi:ubiquinone/menaquinone biosynthesis C-methylase UbiE